MNNGEEHGTVAQFSTEGILVDDRLASGSWIGIPTAGAGTHFFIELDLYLDGNVGSGFRFMLKQPGEMVLALDVSLQNNTLQDEKRILRDYYLEPAADILGTRLRYEVDLTEKLYNVYINGEPAAQGISGRGDADSCGNQAGAVLKFSGRNNEVCPWII